MSDDAQKPRKKRPRRDAGGPEGEPRRKSAERSERAAAADGAEVSSKALTATAKSRLEGTAPPIKDVAPRPARSASTSEHPPSAAELGQRERRLRVMIAVSALSALLGIGVVGMSQAWFVGAVRRDQASTADPGPNGKASTAAGAALTLLGAIALMYSIHRFGRLGVDAPPRAPAPPAETKG